MDHLTTLRKEYYAKPLIASQLPDNPFVLFEEWFSDVLKAKLPEPNAMILATVGANGQPSARTMLLKAASPKGFSFFTHLESHKGHQLKENPQVALLFPWYAIERQIRIEGIAQEVGKEEADAYFQQRPRGAQLTTWVTPQSQSIPSYDWLLEHYKAVEAQYPEGSHIPRPPHWGGFCVVPHTIEFWQGAPNRLHSRIQYKKTSNKSTWEKEVLAS